MNNPESFIRAIFDFSFSSFIIARLIKLLYGIALVVSALISLSLIVIGFADSAGAGIFMLIIVAPLAFIILTIYSRVILELIIVAFRIAENTSEIAAQGRQETPNI